MLARLWYTIAMPWSEADLALVTAVAPFDIWESQYNCGDSSPLLFHPEYSNSVVQDDASSYRKLVVRTVLRAPGTVASHRWCAGSTCCPRTPHGNLRAQAAVRHLAERPWACTRSAV